MRVRPMVKRGWAMAPVVIEVARQVEKQVGPHVRAWQLATSVDGYVGRWTDHAGTHWVVFKDVKSAPVQAFPPLSDADLSRAGRDLDPSALRHHQDLPEATALARARRLRERSGGLTRLPARVRTRRPPRD